VTGTSVSRTVVVVDADPAARRTMVGGLRAAGIGAVGAASGMVGLERVVGEGGAGVVAVAPIPDLRLSQFVPMLRAAGASPVIAVARPGLEAVEALDAGADDVVGYRPDPPELAARVAAAAPGRRDPGPVRVGELVVDPGARTACLGRRSLQLSPKEFELLWALARRRGGVATKRELLAEVWRGGPSGAKTVDVHLSWLRRKLGESGSEPRYLRTVRGVGLRLADPGT
jgi:DNA-binding response OmpR family regulator